MKLKRIVYDMICRGHAILGSADLILRLGCLKTFYMLWILALDTRFGYSSAYSSCYYLRPLIAL
jgi:hypothetical protein